MSLFKGRLGLLLVFALLGGCGFQPLYGPNNETSLRAMSAIQVDLIPDRTGQMLRQGLIHSLTPYGPPKKPKYRLSVVPTFATTSLAFLSDETSSRNQINLTCSIKLTTVDGQLLHAQTIKVYTDYNLVNESDYSTVMAEESAQHQAVHLAAAKIKLAIVAYFATHPSEKTT